MQLDIISPENKIFSGEVLSVQMPGKEGLFQVLDNHAPIISTLANGTVKIDLASSVELDDLHNSLKQEGTTLYYEIKGGVAEVQNNKLILLAD